MTDLTRRAAYEWTSRQKDGYYLVTENAVRFHEEWHEKWLELAPSMPEDWRMLRIAFDVHANFTEDRVNDTHWVRVVKRNAECKLQKKAESVFNYMKGKDASSADAWTGKRRTYVTDENRLDSALFTSTRRSGKPSSRGEGSTSVGRFIDFRSSTKTVREETV